MPTRFIFYVYALNGVGDKVAPKIRYRFRNGNLFRSDCFGVASQTLFAQAFYSLRQNQFGNAVVEEGVVADFLYRRGQNDFYDVIRGIYGALRRIVAGVGGYTYRSLPNGELGICGDSALIAVEYTAQINFAVGQGVVPAAVFKRCVDKRYRREG